MTPTGSKPGGWTYDEFARLPEDGNRYEVIAGELYVTPSRVRGINWSSLG